MVSAFDTRSQLTKYPPNPFQTAVIRSPNFRILDFFNALFDGVIAREASILEDC
jgi:hypothetical protein